MPFARHGELGPERARGVIVLLPGFGDRPERFEDRGFIEVLRRRAPGYDVVAADAHFGYYRKRTLITRLDEDVVGPLRDRGYREIWLSGASMGGHGAVAYARMHPERVRGLLLFAPYMGSTSVIEEVEQAGGLCAWQPPAAYVDDRDGFARANFAWLKQTSCAEGSPVSVYLGVGDRDRLLTPDLLLGAHLPEGHLVILPGGHGFSVWTQALDTLSARAFSDARQREKPEGPS
jgi:pimeloyl-ACP methyl ester carboxylesterase